MRSFTIFPLTFLLVSSGTASPKKTPSHVTSCKKDSTDLSRCIANALETLRPMMGEGIPKYKIPPLEPFLVPEVTLNKTSDALDLQTTMTNLAISGTTNVIVSKLNVDLTDLVGSVSMAFADLNVTTLYVMDALFMKMVPMIGQGRFNGTLKDVRVDLSGRAELSPKDELGHSYLKIIQLKMKGFIGDARGNMVDTSNNPENVKITKAANAFYEDYRREVLDILTPVIAELCEELVLKVANQALSTVPFEDMFAPDSE